MKSNKKDHRSSAWSESKVNNLPLHCNTEKNHDTGFHSYVSHSCAPTAKHAGANTDILYKNHMHTTVKWITYTHVHKDKDSV